MTDGTAAAVQDGEQLKNFLAAKALSKVLFIDDGFEALDQIEPSGIEQNELWTAIESDSGALAAAAAEGLMGPDDLTGEAVAMLLRRAEGDALLGHAEAASYVVNHASKTQELRCPIDYLRSLGVTVLTAGRNSWQDQVEGVSIVFLDWRLGPESNKTAAVETAARTARQIHDRPGPDRPMIVLVSSDPAVKEQARPFSQQSGLIPGLFDAMPKSWLRDRASVDLQMTVLGEHLQKGQVVQNFVDAVQSRTTEAMITFVQAVRNLTLSDYANLQHFALKNEGHPLGDYLTELLAGVWVDALFRGQLRDQLRALDKEDFESLPALMEPSEAVAQLYNAATFDTHVGDFELHPHAEPLAEGQPRRLALALGDIVVEQDGTKSQKVYMIINPQCDLAESPRHQRRINDELSVLLVPGELRPIGAPERTERKETADTPYFSAEGAKGRIQWEGKKQISVPYGKLSDWLAEKPRTRRARMRPTFALALQTAVRSELNRVGLPVPPPMYESLEVKMRRACKGAWDGDVVTKKLGRLLMARGTSEDQFVLTHEFLTELCGIVQDGARVLAGGTKDDPAKAAQIEKALRDPAELQKLVKPFKIPVAITTFLAGSVLICRESKEPKPSFDRRHVICLLLPD